MLDNVSFLLFFGFVVCYFFLINLYLCSVQSFSHIPGYRMGMWIQRTFTLCAFLSICFLYLQKQFSVRKDKDS